MPSLFRRFTTGAAFVVAATALAGCSSPTATPAAQDTGIPANAVLQSAVSDLGRSIAAWQMTNDGKPPTTAAEVSAAGGMLTGTVTTTYYTDGAQFCIKGTAMGVISVYDSAAGGAQPIGTSSCPASYTPVS